MNNDAIKASAILGLLVAVGLAAAGYFASETVYKGRLAGNAVTVKGFAERDVQADLALWQLGYSITGGDIAALYKQSQSDQDKIVAFLKQKGFKDADIQNGSLNVTDQFANQYRSNQISADERYIIQNTISVRSNDVKLVADASKDVNDFIQQGIILTTNNVDYEFTKLNDIKSPMLREATQNARGAAQQFANDAGSTVGSIQSANQGLFSIVSRDAADQSAGGGEGYGQANTVEKKVRVVVTLTYYLEK